MKALIQLFQQTFASDPVDIVRLPIAGSNRQYFRLTNDTQRVVGVIGTSIDENRTFCFLANHLKSKGIPVPTLYAYTDDYACYLQEDLGDVVLFDKNVQKGREIFYLLTSNNNSSFSLAFTIFSSISFNLLR